MLLSLVLALTPTHTFRPNGFYGRQARAWFLGLVARHDPGYAEALHAYSGPKPYTVSSLWSGPQHRLNGDGPIRPGDLCFIRLTSLDDRLSELILDKILPDLPSQMRLKRTVFKPLGRAKWREWDSQTTFDELIDQATAGQKNSRATLELASPTAFRSEGIDLTLPTADQVWRGLYWRWQTFAPEDLQINSLWAPFSSSCIVVSDFNLQSGKIIFRDGAKGVATGATGRITYRLLPAKHCGDLADFRPGAEQVLHLLAGFSLFAGLGHHTTIGLGQTRCISHGSGRQDGQVINSRYHRVNTG